MLQEYRFLNNELILDVELGQITTTNLHGIYKVYRVVPTNIDSDEGQIDELIFNGTVFVTKGQDVLPIYLNDILQSQKELDNAISGIYNNTMKAGDVYTKSNYSRYKIEVVLYDDEDGEIFDYMTTFNVALFYEYPTDARATKCIIDTDPIYSGLERISLLREGFDNTTLKQTLIPHIPNTDDNYVFGTYFIPTYDYLKSRNGRLNFGFYDKEGYKINDWNIYTKECISQYYNVYSPTRTIPDRYSRVVGGSWQIALLVENKSLYPWETFEGILKDIYNDRPDLFPLLKDTSILKFQYEMGIILIGSASDEATKNAMFVVLNNHLPEGDLKPYSAQSEYVPIEEIVTVTNATFMLNGVIPLAQVDMCPSDFYLLWYDRYGGMQCQPFDGTSTFQESLKETRTQNNILTKRVASKEIIPTWKISSKWLSEVEYKIYESIFVSPYICLFDVKNKKVHGVMVIDKQYTEKTYKNNGNKPINIQITLEKARNQRILY